MTSRWIACLCLTAGCGRVAFDPVSIDAPPNADAFADAPFVAPSCAVEQRTCGPAGTDDCCARLVVPGGTFLRSYDVANDLMYANMSNPATVSRFALDRYEVTVGRFRAWVDAGQGLQSSAPAVAAGERPSVPGSGWETGWTPSLAIDRVDLISKISCEVGMRQTWLEPAGATESNPINCVDWFQAFAFCVWDGGWLPTEAEWNFAAAGGSEQRAFPWSSPPSDTTLDCNRAATGGCAGGTLVAGTSSPSGDGRWGHADLAGNVWEWVLDSNAAYTNPCVDCATVAGTGGAVIRGGSFFDGPNVVRTGNRIGTTGRSTAIGFRCAYPAP